MPTRLMAGMLAATLPLAGAMAAVSMKATGVPAGVAAGADPEIRYALELRPPGKGEGLSPAWVLRISGNGLDPKRGPVHLVFESWGEWMMVDSWYLDVLDAEPSLAAEPWPGNTIRLAAPKSWKGHFQVDVRLRPARMGTNAQARWGLLPYWTPTYAFGQTQNVFPHVYQGDGDLAEVEGARVVEVRGTRGQEVVTGWGGVSRGVQEVAMDPAQHNGLFAVGAVRGRAMRRAGDVPVEVAAALQFPPPDPMVVFVTDEGGGGMGSHHGLVVGFTADTPDWMAQSPYFHQLIGDG